MSAAAGPAAAGATAFVVDDDPAVRAVLRNLLGSVRVPVETYDDARQFLDRFDVERPGCLVLDVRLPGMSGLDLQTELYQRGAAIPIIVMTAYADVSIAVRALRAGAVDFIEKPFTGQTILDRIQQAIEQDRCNREAEARYRAFAKRAAALTPREREVLDLLVCGRSSKQIAAELGLSRKTVETYRANLMSKAEVRSLAQLIRFGLELQHRLVPRA